MNGDEHHDSYWKMVWQRYKTHRLGMLSLLVILLFTLTGIYAPFLAASKPLIVNYEGTWYFPLFRYLFYKGYYSKNIDLFFNLLIFSFPLALAAFSLIRKKKRFRFFTLALICSLQIFFFILFASGYIKDPASDSTLNEARQAAIQKRLKNQAAPLPSWQTDLSYMNAYAKLNTLLRYQQRKMQQNALEYLQESYAKDQLKKWLKSAVRDKRAALLRQGVPLQRLPDDTTLKNQIIKETPDHLITKHTALPTLWNLNQERESQEKRRLIEAIKTNDDKHAKARLHYLEERRAWLENESEKLHAEIWPLLRNFHWEEDAGGDQDFNRYVAFWQLTRINRKDMLAALIFGVRISLVVGVTAVSLALAIGIPVGSIAGYYGGNFDIIVCRLLEIWESMPTFFMLLLVVAITQSKSIFLIITVIGLFGWTSFSRYIRGEFFKQRNLPYVEACRATGFNDAYIIFKHILPNAIPPILTLLPFAVMAAITSEAGLSFLGLGEEGSSSWGILMDEGRNAFPGESYLLWPPAILLTLLLIAIALVGDALRDTLDPKEK